MKLKFTRKGKKGTLRAVELNANIRKGDGIFSRIDESDFSFDQNLFLDNLTSGKSMFMGNEALTSFNSNLSSLTNGEGMFSGTQITSFNKKLNNLKNGSSMFSSCSELTSFNIELPNLVLGEDMFSRCSSLTSFTSNTNKLKVADYMFNVCKELTTINSNFQSLVFGHSMFDGCVKLTDFNGSLASFIVGGYLFSDCSLSAQSVLNIANGIKDVNSLLKNAKVVTEWTGYDTWADGCYKHKTSGQYLYVQTIEGERHDSAFGWGEPGQMWLDVKSSMSSSDLTILSNALDTFAAKGWSVYSGTIPDGVSISEEGGENTSLYVYVLTDFFKKATHINTNGKPVQMCVAKSIYSTREHNYKLFPSKEEAEIFYGLTPIESN